MATVTHDGTTIPTAPPKDPDSRIDYGFDWTNWLASGETISTSTWVLETGLTYVSDTTNGNITTVMISSGTIGYTYIITNRITTNEGRQEDRSMYITVKSK